MKMHTRTHMHTHAYTHIHKHTYTRQAGAPRLASQCRPRLLCLVGSPDVPMQYIPIMNTIFSAQRAEVAMDALVGRLPMQCMYVCTY